MKVRVKFYGLVFDEVGVREQRFELEKNSTLGHLLDLIVETYPALKNLVYDEKNEFRNYLQVAINGEILFELSSVLGEKDVVQVMPPIGGG